MFWAFTGNVASRYGVILGGPREKSAAGSEVKGEKMIQINF